MVENINGITHFSPIPHFYTPPKTSENHWFPDVFRGYRNEPLGSNGPITNMERHIRTKLPIMYITEMLKALQLSFFKDNK